MATVNLDCKLDLKTIAFHARNVEYNPKVINPRGGENARGEARANAFRARKVENFETDDRCVGLIELAFCGGDHAHSQPEDDGVNF